MTTFPGGFQSLGLELIPQGQLHPTVRSIEKTRIPADYLYLDNIPVPSEACGIFDEPLQDFFPVEVLKNYSPKDIQRYLDTWKNK